MYQRISKKEAFNLFSQGKTVYFIPCKMRIGTMWHIECPISLTDDLIESAKMYEKHFNEKDISSYSAKYAHLWHGTIEKTAWNLIYNNWTSYNTNYEMGYYAHYYIKVEKDY